LNYADHARESNLALPSAPLCFAKWTTSLIGDGDDVLMPRATEKLDYEAELAVVIGRRALDVSVEDALDYVAGYACFNDLSTRDLQAADGQWTRSKSFDTLGVLGSMVPASAVPDPNKLHIRCTLNGETVQDSNTSEMVFSVASIISYFSQDTTLEAGDVIATGTPAGIGLAKRPPRFLTDGDVVSVEIERIGSITNRIRRR
jgi:2-keto-4-pentenoate hydratase/2-oxohepta-3-ene-1,7-dioic acid hydratase in catechol pathway